MYTSGFVHQQMLTMLSDVKFLGLSTQKISETSSRIIRGPAAFSQRQNRLRKGSWCLRIFTSIGTSYCYWENITYYPPPQTNIREKAPELVHLHIWKHLLYHNLLGNIFLFWVVLVWKKQKDQNFQFLVGVTVCERKNATDFVKDFLNQTLKEISYPTN